MKRNNLMAGLAGLLLISLCTTPVTAQQTEPANSAVQAQQLQPVQVQKSAVAKGGAMWEVTLTVQGGGQQAITESVDIVLLLDANANMTQEWSAVQPPAKAAVLPKETVATVRLHAKQLLRADGQAVRGKRTGRLYALAQQAASDLPDGSADAQARPVREAAQRTATPGTAPLISPAQRTTRIGAAKAGLQTFLSELMKQGVPARVGAVMYAGEAQVILPLTQLDGGAGSRTVENAVENLWQAAYGPEDLCFGSGRGANLERAFAAADTMLKESAAFGKYVVAVGGTQPAAYGVAEQSCLVPETDKAYADEQKVIAATRAAAQGLFRSGVARVFTVGVGTQELSAYASQGAAYSATNTEIAKPLQEIACLLGKKVQCPAVTDAAGEGLLIEPASAVCTPERLGVGAQPYAKVAPDGKTLYWSLGAWLSEGETATLRYTLKAADPTYESAGKDLPLGAATLVYSTPDETGALRAMGAPFAVPTVRYATGTLQVYSSGLPAQLGGTAQRVGATPVTGTAWFQLQKPAEHSGWRIESILVNGQPRVPSQFEQETQYRLPVKEGATVVEYRYVPAPDSVAQWSYTVQYYRDGLLLPECTQTGTVAANAPMVERAPSQPEALQGSTENPARSWPYTLSGDGEVLRVDYLTLPREGAQISVRHVYTDGENVTLGMHTTAPAQDAASYNVRELFSLGYGGNVYMPVLATLTLTSADGTQAQQKNLPLGTAFSCAQGERGLLEIRYVPLKVQQPPAPESAPVTASGAASVASVAQSAVSGS